MKKMGINKLIIYLFILLVLNTNNLLAQYSVQNINFEKDSCDGSFELNANGNTFPLEVILFQATDTMQRLTIDKPGIFPFTGVCSGDYEVRVTNYYNCDTTIKLTIGYCSGTFVIKKLGIADKVNSNINDGYISVIGYPGGVYSYRWSTGDSTPNISGLAPGRYIVGVTDKSTGCSDTAEYTINSCSFGQSGGKPFEILIENGISVDGFKSTPLLSIKDSGSTSYRTYGPQYDIDFQVIWKVNDKEVARNATGINAFFDNNSELIVTVIVSRGCLSKTATKKLIKCDDKDKEKLKNYFVKSIKNPCTLSSDGEIVFNSADIKNNLGYIKYDGITVRGPLSEELKIKDISAGVHKISIVTEIGCDYSFDLEIAADPPTKAEFLKFNSVNFKCDYNLFCRTNNLGIEERFPDLRQSTSKGSILDRILGRTPCRYDVLCDGVVRTSSSPGYPTVYGSQYIEILSFAAAAGIINEQDFKQLSENFEEFGERRFCQQFQYCPFDMRISLHTSKFAAKPKITSFGDCITYNCRNIFNPIQPKITICKSTIAKDARVPDFIVKNQPDVTPCSRRIANLVTLISSSREFYGTGKFKGSELEDLFLKVCPNDGMGTQGYHFNIPAMLKLDKKYACSSVTYCTDDFRVIKADTLVSHCGSGGYYCTPKFDHLTLTDSVFEIKCADFPLLKITFKVPYNREVTLAPPVGEDKFVTDSIPVDYIQDIVKINSSFGMVAKPIISYNHKNKVLDYNPDPNEDHAIYFGQGQIGSVQDWNTMRLMDVFKLSKDTLGLNIQLIDSVIEKSLSSGNVAGSYINLKKLYLINNNYFICGIKKGGITLDNIAQTDSVSGDALFIYKMSGAGTITSKYVTAINDTNKVNFFEGPNNLITFSVLPTTLLANTLYHSMITMDENLNIVNSIPITAAQGLTTTGEVLAIASDRAAKNLYVFSGPITQKSDSASVFEYTLYKYNKPIIQSGPSPTYSQSYLIKKYRIKGGYSNKSTFQMSIDSVNNIIIATQISGNLIQVNPDNSQSIVLGADKNDIAVIKMDSAFNVKGFFINRTPEDESITHALLTDQVLYFGGISHGTNDKILGNHRYYNRSGNDSIAYMTYLFLDQLDSITVINNLSAQNPVYSLSKFEPNSDNIKYKISLYPNPFGDKINLSFFNNPLSEIQALNQLGTVIYKQKIDPTTNYMSVDTRSWGSGVFFLKLIDINKTLVETRKIVKLK